jgi:hypothetical protein
VKWSEEQLEKYKRWKELVNMSPSQIKAFLDSEDGEEAGISKKTASKLKISRGRDSARAIIRMLEKGRENWDANDLKWMNKQISFISRMKGNPGPLYDKDGNKTRKHTSLLVWGHNPRLVENIDVANMLLDF